MSAANQSTIVYTPNNISLSSDFSDAEKKDINDLLDLLQANNTDLNVDAQQANITRFVDGRGMACPMPLLKTKVALRDVADGESLYVVATDANSQADITAFCRQSQQNDTANQLRLIVNSVTNQHLANGISSQGFDTIYHFIITKTDSN